MILKVSPNGLQPQGHGIWFFSTPSNRGHELLKIELTQQSPKPASLFRTPPEISTQTLTSLDT